MEKNNTPDEWDQHDIDEAGDQEVPMQIEKGMAGLNVKAPVFVPGKNVFADEFVPSFVKIAQPSQQTTNSVNTSPSHPSGNSACAPEVSNSIVVEPEVSALPLSVVTSKDNMPASVNNIPSAASKIEYMETSSGIPEFKKSSIPIEKEKISAEEDSDDWSGKAVEENGGGSTPTDDGGGADDDDAMGDEEVVKAMAASRQKKKVKQENEIKKDKEHLNIVFIGHVDAGKSTIGGHIMYLTGMVDKRTLEKYEREAKEKSRESWYLSWALDTNQEERDKGKTVEVGRAYFETESKHFTILDAPGHKSFVPNMISGASQADVAVLVISARKGEFETGFERGGQTREHAMLVKTAGVKHLIVAVNKMDDPTVEWDINRYNEISEKLTPYLKKCGFNPKTDIYYLPISGQNGINLKSINRDICPWYSGPALIEYLDDLPTFGRSADGPVRMPIVDRYKDMGTIVLGKVESGQISKGQIVTMMPNKANVEIIQLWSDEDEVDVVRSGENVKLKLKNVEEEEVSPGFVLCSPDNLCHSARVFDAQIAILEYKSIICAGYSAVMHIHCCAEEVVLKMLICLVDKKTGEKSKTRPRFVKQDQTAIVRLELLNGAVCMEPYKDFPQMGRFTLRDEGKTIGQGKVLKIVA